MLRNLVLAFLLFIDLLFSKNFARENDAQNDAQSLEVGLFVLAILSCLRFYYVWFT